QIRIFLSPKNARGNLRFSTSGLFRIVRLVLPVQLDASRDAVIFAWENVILAKRKSLPVVGAENAPQIRMAGEIDPEHVVSLALVPIRRRPEIRHRRNARLLARR